MKNRKILIISVVILIIIILLGLFLSTGGKRTDVFLKDFSFDEKCNQMTIKVGVSSSVGYVRKMKQTSGSMNGYYTFYSTFGINSRLGAKDTFEIQLDNNVDEIYFYTGGKGYKKVLEKNENGEWIKSLETTTTQELKLKYRDSLDIELEPDSPQEKNINLKYSNVPETKEQKYNNNKELSVFANYVKENFDIELDSKWNVTVHYYDENMTIGMVEFNYMIDEIKTNKNIVFNLDNGVSDIVYYKYLEKSVNEEDLLNRVKIFKDKYTQEKKVFKDDEKFDSEITNYSYYYGVDKLVYFYAIFFSYGEHQVINNDYGTIYMIDENGDVTK